MNELDSWYSGSSGCDNTVFTPVDTSLEINSCFTRILDQSPSAGMLCGFGEDFAEETSQKSATGIVPKNKIDILDQSRYCTQLSPVVGPRNYSDKITCPSMDDLTLSCTQYLKIGYVTALSSCNVFDFIQVILDDRLWMNRWLT